MKTIIDNIEIKKINNGEVLYNFLKQFTLHEKVRYFLIEDEFCNNPEIRVMEQYEVDSGKRFNFKYDGSRWFWTGDDESYYDIIQISAKIYNLILRDYK